MAEDSVIIIGSGLGGLLCGRILSRKGWSVTLLEQGAQPGGALQTFVRDGVRFDTGFHSVGGLGRGEELETIFRPLGLMELPWQQMEADECVGGEAFLRLSTGWDEERKHILGPYRQSVWRLEGGGKTLVDALADGQQILLHKKVTAIEDRTVICSDGSTFRSDIVISDIHPLITMRLVRDHFRPAYLHRLERTANSPGISTVYCKLRPSALRHINHSIFLDNTVMIHFGVSDEAGFARSLELMAFEQPGSDWATDLIKHAAKHLPELPSAIENYWTSTPRTWERYTGTPGGSAYGICKHNKLDYIAPQT
ncbi:MAG: NAD(P)-binding protein, partial [Bacteroidales bacterium]|nr:NAD(P)-binding protein [Bacteroidales bacterium]